MKSGDFPQMQGKRRLEDRLSAIHGNALADDAATGEIKPKFSFSKGGNCL